MSDFEDLLRLAGVRESVEQKVGEYPNIRLEERGYGYIVYDLDNNLIAKIEKINGGNWRPGMLRDGYIIMYHLSDNFGWQRMKTVKTEEEALRFVQSLAGVKESLDPELTSDEPEELLLEDDPEEIPEFATKQDLDKALQDDINSFEHLFFAFNNEQYEEGFKKMGLEHGVDKVVSIGAGGYVPKKYINDFIAMMDKHERWKKAFRKQQRERKKQHG